MDAQLLIVLPVDHSGKKGEGTVLCSEMNWNHCIGDSQQGRRRYSAEGLNVCRARELNARVGNGEKMLCLLLEREREMLANSYGRASGGRELGKQTEKKMLTGERTLCYFAKKMSVYSEYPLSLSLSLFLSHITLHSLSPVILLYSLSCLRNDVMTS